MNRSLLEPALSASTTQQEKSESIASARQVARYLVENVLQGVQKSEAEIAYGKLGDFSPSFSAENRCLLLRYIYVNAALRITSQTALGDNSTIKNVTPAPSLDEIKASMNKGDTSDNSNAPRRRRRRSADKSVEENLSQAGETSVSGTSSS